MKLIRFQMIKNKKLLVYCKRKRNIIFVLYFNELKTKTYIKYFLKNFVLVF